MNAPTDAPTDAKLDAKTDAKTKAQCMRKPSLPIIPLSRDDLPVGATQLARFMIGKYLVHDVPEGRMSGRIVETEAYPVGDSTSHAFIGRRPHNGSMFLAPGYAYVRLTYGLSYMLNMSAEAEDVGAGILIRAVEPRRSVS